MIFLINSEFHGQGTAAVFRLDENPLTDFAMRRGTLPCKLIVESPVASSF